jgi:CxxC motif-containing protein
MTTRNLTCIGCPLGCKLTAEIENGVVISVIGNTCKKGDAYARKECVAPARTVTGTVRLSGGALPVVSVKTADEVPKERIFEVAAAYCHIHPTAPVSIGDVLAHNVAGTGVDVIATRNVAARA